MADLATQLRDYLDATAPEVSLSEVQSLQTVRPAPEAGAGRRYRRGLLIATETRVTGRRGLFIAAAAMAAVLVVAIPLWFAFRGGESRILIDQITITYPPTPEGKTPTATVEELVGENYAALTNKDGESLRAVNLDGARGLVYFVDGQVGRVMGTVGPTYDPAEDVDQVWEVLGEFTVSGEAVAIPMRVTYPSEGKTVTGFDLWVVSRFEGGLLCAGGVTFGAFEPFVEADPTVVDDLLAAQAAAWQAGDIEGVLADYWEAASYLDGFSFGSRPSARLAEFYAGMRLEFTGRPAISGPFVAVPTRVTDRETGATTDGVSVYWIREGEIALHAFSPGV
jgi:hypothetical protein